MTPPARPIDCPEVPKWYDWFKAFVFFLLGVLLTSGSFLYAYSSRLALVEERQAVVTVDRGETRRLLAELSTQIAELRADIRLLRQKLAMEDH